MKMLQPNFALPVRLFAVLLAVLAAATASAQRERSDAPVLISTDGGGPQWKNVEELKGFARRGNAEACFELGDRLMHGDGVTKNLPEARQYLERAAQGGNANAWFRLGKIYHDGLGVPANRAKGFDCYTEAAKRGVPEAMHNVGAMLVSARGVKRDYVEGLAWLKVAPAHGAVSSAEQQVRRRLERRPAEIARADARAKELLAAISDPNNTGVAPKVAAPGPAITKQPSFEPAAAPPPKVEISVPKFAAPVTAPVALPGAKQP